VDDHRFAFLAQLAPPLTEPVNQLFAGVDDRDRVRVTDDRPPVLPQDDPAESCDQIRFALPLLPGLKTGPGPPGGMYSEVLWAGMLTGGVGSLVAVTPLL